MNKLIASSLLLLAVVAVAAGQGTYDLKQMREYFKKRIPNGPYIYLQSPRTGLGVGTVYTVVDGQNVFYSRPADCFSSSFLTKVQNPSQADQMAVANFDNVTGKYSWQLGLRVANAGPITEEVKADFGKNRVSSMTLKMPYLKRYLITIRDLKDAISKEMDADCQAVLTAKKPERWIILEALYTDELAIEFQDAGGANVGISAGILAKIFPTFKYEKEGTVKGTLQLKGENHIVAVKAVKIADLTKYAAGDIQLIAVDPDEFYPVIDRR